VSKSELVEFTASTVQGVVMPWLLTLLLSLAFAADPPLAVRALAGPPSQVELRNTATQPINAWAFAISSPNANGGIHRVFHSSDVYMSEVTSGLQGAETHLRVLQPGESRTVPVDPLPRDATVQVMAAVLDDNTAFGDDQTIAGIFQKRIVERDQLKQVVDIFNASLQAQQGAAVLQDLKRRFAAGAGADESPAHRSARQAVDAFLQRAAGNTEDVIPALRTYVGFVTKQYEAAAKHAQRRA
jgi:hypothetical protein